MSTELTLPSGPVGALPMEGPAGSYSASTALANCWSTVATEYSLSPHELYPWDSFLVEQMQKVNPDFVPVWIRRVYQLPTGGIKIMGYHGFGAYITGRKNLINGEVDEVQAGDVLKLSSIPRNARQGLVKLTRPLDGTFTGSGDYREFVPFDGRVFHFYRAAYAWAAALRQAREARRKELEAVANREKVAKAKAEEERAKEARYSLHADRHMIRRAVEQEKFMPDEPQKTIRVFHGPLHRSP